MVETMVVSIFLTLQYFLILQNSQGSIDISNQHGKLVAMLMLMVQNPSSTKSPLRSRPTDVQEFLEDLNSINGASQTTGQPVPKQRTRYPSTKAGRAITRTHVRLSIVMTCGSQSIFSISAVSYVNKNYLKKKP